MFCYKKEVTSSDLTSSVKGRGDVDLQTRTSELNLLSHFLVFFPLFTNFYFFSGGYLDSREPIFLICGTYFEWGHVHKRQTFFSQLL